MNRVHGSAVFGERITNDGQLRSRGPHAVHWARREARGDFRIWHNLRGGGDLNCFCSKLNVSFPSGYLYVNMAGFALRGSYFKLEVKVKVKFTLEQATKARMGSRGIAVLFL